MALFTDGPVSAIEDLTGQDSQLLDVASGEGIDVTRKLAVAQEEIACELESLLARMSSGSAPGLDCVVATPPLKMWHTFRTLEMVYADAFNSQLNDRYKGRRDQFHNQARWAYEKLIQIGIGIVANPVPRAATPLLSPADGMAVPDGTYFVTASWVNASGEEGACANCDSIDISGTTLSVIPGVAPACAAGWNVYVGTSETAMTLQNPAPIAVGTQWVQPAMLFGGGRSPSRGQSPMVVYSVPRTFQRG
jgi:hypothetical protein